MEQRGEHLSIFDINHKKAPTPAEITLTLTANPSDNSDSTVIMVDWIADGIKAQNDQWVQDFISHLVFCWDLLDHGFYLRSTGCLGSQQ